MPYERLIANISGKHRKDILEGRPHIVVPCTMLTEDVINGSQGPLFYPKEENGRSPSDWNAMPVVVYHPQVNGQFVSARQHTFLDSRKIGLLLNTMHDDRLRTEVWFDEERTKAVDKRVYDAITNDKPMEVSTGLELVIDKAPGEFNGKKYDGVARNHKPDHLAILPDKIGACSVAMGGGLFANSANEPESTQTFLSRAVQEALKPIGVEMSANAMSFSSTTRMLSDALASAYGQKGRYWDGWVCEVFPDKVIFGDGNGKMMMVEYTATDTSVSLKGTAVEVVRTLQYKTVDGKTVAGNQDPTPTKETTPMAFDKTAHVNTLIGNGFVEADRAKLMGMDDDILSKIQPKATVPAPTPPAPVPTGNAVPTGPLTMEQLKQVLPPQFWAVHNYGEKALQRDRDAYITTIKANPNNKFSDAALNAMDPDMLAATAELAKTPVGNSGTDPRFVDGWYPGGPANFMGANGFAPTPGVANDLDEPPVVNEDMVFDNPMAQK